MKILVEEPYWKGEWVAIDDDRYCGCEDCRGWPSATGSSPQEAVENLRERFEVREDDEGIMACDIWLSANRDEQ